MLNHYIRTGKKRKGGKYKIDYAGIIEYLEPLPKSLKGYNIHHIKPLNKFNFVNKDNTLNFKEIQEAFKPENHQLLTIEEHRAINHKAL